MVSSSGNIGSRSPRILLTDARIYRSANDTAPAGAMLVEAGRVAWIGESSERPTADYELRMNGLTVLPGLTDAHVHILAVAQARLQVSAADASITSMAGYLERLKAAARNTSPGQWILGTDINEQFWPEMRLPNRFDLDAILPDRRVALRRFCGHVVMLNTPAMEALESQVDFRAGGMDQDDRGPTGIAREAAADAVFRNLPRPGDADLSNSVHRIMAELASSGITAANEAAMGFTFGFEPEWNLWQRIRAAGTVPLRLGFMLQTDPETAHLATGGPFLDPWWQIRTLKLFADGIIGARTAALSGGFADGAPSGTLLQPAADIEAFIAAAHEAAWQIGIHAIGDLAIDLVARAYLRCRQEDGTVDPRHRIEHLGVPNSEALLLLRQAGAVVVTQPSFVRRMGDSWHSALGARQTLAFPARSAIEAGVPLAGSSDAPTGSLCPWEGISAFVLRRAKSGAVIAPDECLTLRQAFHAYTVGGAYAMHQDSWRGRLEPGCSADFAAYDIDPISTAPEELPQLRSKLTVTGGILTHNPGGYWTWPQDF